MTVTPTGTATTIAALLPVLRADGEFVGERVGAKVVEIAGNAAVSDGRQQTEDL